MILNINLLLCRQFYAYCDKTAESRITGFCYKISLYFSYLQVNSALHPSGDAISSTSFGWGKDRKVIAAGWQVRLCDPLWHMISSSGVVISITNCFKIK